MGPRETARRCAWRVCCGIISCTNFLLAFTALMLTGLILLNNIQKEIPLPAKFTTWAMEQAIGSGYALHWDRAVFDLRGGVYLENVVIHDTNGTDVLLEARMIQLDFQLFNLALDIPPVIEEVNASGVSLFIPSHLSPSGLNEPVVEVRQLKLYKEDHALILQHLLLESRGIRLHATGSAPVDTLFKESPEPRKTTDWKKMLVQLMRLPDDLSADCRLFWTAGQGGTHLLEIHTVAPYLRLPGAELEALSLSANAEVVGTSIRISAFHGDALLAGADAAYLPEFLANRPPQLPIRLTFSAFGNPTSRAGITFPERVSLMFSNPLPDMFPAERVLLETSLVEQDTFMKFILKGPGLFAAGVARPLPENPGQSENTLPFSADFRAEFLQPKLHAFFPSLPEGRMLKDAGAGFIRFNARSNPSISRGFTGRLTCDDLLIAETSFAHVQSAFSVDASRLAMPDIHIQKNPREQASGSYFHEFASSRFSLNAAGKAFPHSLDALLGRWWQRIFTHIQATEPLPADVTVWGLWAEPLSLESYTAVRGGGARYRETPIPEMEVRVRSNAEWAYLEHLEATFEDGSVGGRIAWGQGIESGELRPMLLDLKSDAPWEVVVSASGIEGLGELHFAGNPRASAKGWVWQSREKDPENILVPELQISLSNPGKVSEIAGLELDGISFAGNVTAGAVNLPNVSGTFAEGVFAGEIRLLDWMEEGEQTTYLDLNLLDADYPEALTELSKLLKNPEPFRESLVNNAEGGRADSSLELWIGPTPESWRGTGQLTLREANIGQVHIFGGLSRFLDKLGLGFSTLDLEAAALDWTLANNQLEISDCIITGPVLNLALAGQVDLAARELDMQAEAAFFSGLFSKLLTPVSDNFQFDLKGPLEDPIWKLRLNPLRWFQNRLPAGP